jgi:hypothetical protein
MNDQLVLKDIREVWEAIRPGVEHTRLKTEAPWRAEDIYATCVVGQAFVYVGETGFIIVQPKTDPFTGQPEMFIWVAYAEGEGNVLRFQAAVDELARDHDYTKMTMWSTRPGWEKAVGWNAVATVYERHL